MTIKVGINGFGRIGRMVFRAIAKDFPDIEVVGINDLLDPDYLAYMLKYDSVHGHFKGDISVDGGNMVVNGKTIRLTAERDPANLKWDEVGADLVIECTGFFLTEETCQKHIDAGAKKVVQSRALQGRHPDVRVRRQPQYLRRPGHRLHRLLHHQLPGPGGQGAERQLGHQARPDDHRARGHRHPEDRRRPVHEGLARRPRHPGEHHPVLHRRRQGRGRGAARAQRQADRHGLPRAHLRRLRGRPDRRAEQGRQLRRDLRRHEGRLRVRRSWGVLGYTDEKVVSTDFRGRGTPSIFDADAGIALDGTFVKVVSWYDNEYGYTCNMLRMVEHVCQVSGQGQRSGESARTAV